MIGNIALALYIMFALSFTAYYIFVWYGKWHWTTKIIMTIIFTPIFAIILPAMIGVFMAIQYIKELDK